MIYEFLERIWLTMAMAWLLTSFCVLDYSNLVYSSTTAIAKKSCKFKVTIGKDKRLKEGLKILNPHGKTKTKP